MLDIALKEWAVVCDLLLEGSLALLLRKGGIHERGGPGVFALEHERFALYPSWAHQKPHMLKAEYRDRVEVLDEPSEMTFKGIGEAAKIWQVPSREAFDQLDDLHCWSAPQIDMRFNYKPDRPLYLVAVRAYRLASPQTLPVHWTYSGCKSWVPLKDGAIADADAMPALSDDAIATVIGRVDETFGDNA